MMKIAPLPTRWGPWPSLAPWRLVAGLAQLALALAAGMLLLAGCSSTRPPDWQVEAHDALDRAVQARLNERPRVADAELAIARRAVASTGRPDLMARLELHHCAAAIAALAFGPCEPFEALRQDADLAERAYADHLLQALPPERRVLLPLAQQRLAAAPQGADSGVDRLRAEPDALSRLVGAALWQRDGQASAAVAAEAVATASAQGWRRPLVAWLLVQRDRAERAGARDEAQRLTRRIALVLGGQPLDERATGRSLPR